MSNGETADMHFVDDAFVPGSSRRAIGSPSKRRIDNHGLEHAGSAVAAIYREIAVLAADTVTEMRVAPFQFADDLLGVCVKQQFVRIESMPFVRLVGTVN